MEGAKVQRALMVLRLVVVGVRQISALEVVQRAIQNPAVDHWNSCRGRNHRLDNSLREGRMRDAVEGVRLDCFG
jgi:hypothetical protein